MRATRAKQAGDIEREIFSAKKADRIIAGQ